MTIEMAEESGQIRASVGPFLDQQAREQRAHTVRTPFPSRHDKAVRAQSIRGRMAMKGLYIPANAPWRADFEAELLRFPTAAHDDIVDSVSLLGQLLDTIIPGRRPKNADKPEAHRAYAPMRDTSDDAWLSTL